MSNPGLEYTKVAEIRPLLVVSEVIFVFEICGRRFSNLTGFGAVFVAFIICFVVEQHPENEEG